MSLYQNGQYVGVSNDPTGGRLYNAEGVLKSSIQPKSTTQKVIDFIPGGNEITNAVAGLYHDFKALANVNNPDVFRSEAAKADTNAANIGIRPGDAITDLWNKQSLGKAVGAGLQIGSTIAPIGGIGTALAGGAAYGAGTGLSEDNYTAKSVLENTVLGAGIAGVTHGLFKLPGAVDSVLKNNATTKDSYLALKTAFQSGNKVFEDVADNVTKVLEKQDRTGVIGLHQLADFIPAGADNNPEITKVVKSFIGDDFKIYRELGKSIKDGMVEGLVTGIRSTFNHVNPIGALVSIYELTHGKSWGEAVGTYLAIATGEGILKNPTARILIAGQVGKVGKVGKYSLTEEGQTFAQFLKDIGPDKMEKLLNLLAIQQGKIQ